MCTRHDYDLYTQFAGQKCAYCLNPRKLGIVPYKAEGYQVKVCLDCHARIERLAILDNFHSFEPVEFTVEAYA